MMNEEHEYLQIKAILVNDKLVPIWKFDYAIIDHHGDYTTERFTYDNQRFESCDIIDCLYDMKSKLVVRFPTAFLDRKPEHKIGDSVYREVKHHRLKPVTIVNITRGEIELDRVMPRKEVDAYINSDRYSPVGDGIIPNSVLKISVNIHKMVVLFGC